ncbi:MAG: hypothetical protein SOI13_01645 [Bifidobacterium mongoliense]|jgi:hypothetical protein|uniref:hypothetical protein n=1 Tax=Bifidobacterium mongoliense TaxID=518643 RepID=UPI002F353F40
MSFSGFLYGKVGVDVMPVTEGFRRELDAKLRRAVADADVKVPVNVDLDDGAFSAWKEKTRHDAVDQKVNVRFDDAAASKAARKIGKDAGGEFDKSAGESLGKLSSKAAKTRIKVPMDADTREFRREVNREADRLEDTFQKAATRGLKIPDSTALQSARALRTALSKSDFRITPKVELELDEAERQMMRLNRRINLSDEFDRQASEIRRRAERLRAQMPDIEMSVDVGKAIADLEALKADIRDNKRTKLTVREKVEVETHEANEELKRLERRHNELKMDLDLKTKTAAAHMAYFTRPRSVDIFARFRGTDMGKVLNGMTSGATGLKGVENQFQRLVNLMDNLDSKVPKFAMLGSILLSIGAGGTNLMGSVGGVAESLLSMSKVAYAAPAALGAAAAGFYGLYAAVKTAGDHVHIAGTALDGLQGKMGSAFWDKAADSVERMSDALGDRFVSNLRNVASEEGQVVAGLAKIVSAADEGDRINMMLVDSQAAVHNLNPGLQDLVQVITALGRVGGQYLPQFTNWISGDAARFAEWAHSVESDSGRVDKAMSEVKEQAGYLGSSVGSLKGVFTGVFGPLAQYENGLQGFSQTLADLDRNVNSVRFQQSMDEWIAGAQTAQHTVRSSFGTIGEDAYSLRGAVRQSFEDSGRVVGSTVSNMGSLLSGAEPGIRKFTSGIADGWEKSMGAIGDSGPVLSDLLTMVGQLANTFGGTFANSLRAAAPLIEMVARGATSVSEAFAKLPAPVQSAIGLWMTFGKAGMGGLSAIKTGLADNIERTVKYRSMLAGLGMATDDNVVSFKSLAKTWVNMHGANLGEGMAAAEKGIKTAASTAESAGGKMSSLRSSLGKVKSTAGAVGSSLLDALGGPAGIAIGAGVGMMTAVMVDYSTKAQSVQMHSDAMAESIRNVASTAGAAAGSLDSLQKAASDAFKDPDYAKTGWNYFGQGPYKDASTAADKLGISLKKLSTGTATSRTEYQKFMKKLEDGNAAASAKLNNAWKGSGQISREEYLNLTKRTDAYEQVHKAAEQANADAEKQLRTFATQNGHSEKEINSLMAQGYAYEQLASVMQSASQKAENHSTAVKMLSASQKDNASAMLSEHAAASQYYQTLDGIGEAHKRVAELVAQGQNVWNAQAKSFDMTTEAGRTASDAMDALGSNAKSYVQSMIDAGEPIDDIKGKLPGITDSLRDQMTQFGGSKQAADDYIKQLGLTPKDVETQVRLKVEESKLQMAQYLSLMRDLFGPSGQKEYDAVLNAINSGAVTSLDDVQKRIDGFKNGSYKAVLTADGTEVQIAADTAVKLGLSWDGQQYTSKLDATDLASGKLDALVQKFSESGARTLDMQLLLSGDKSAAAKIDNVAALAKALSLTPAEVNLIANTDNASKKLDDIRQKLKGEGLSDKQINVLLDAIDNASPKIKDVIKGKGIVATPSSFVIGADPSNAFDAMGKVESATVTPKTLLMYGDPSDAFNKVQAVNLLSLSSKTSFMFGDNGNLFAAFNVANSLGFANKWAMMFGNNNDVRSKMSEVRAYDGSTLATSWGRILGDASNMQAVARQYDGAVIATSYISVVHRDGGSVKAATGGEIHGPGTSTSDSIPAMLSDGEQVTKAASVASMKALYGASVMNDINATGRIPVGAALASLNSLGALAQSSQTAIRKVGPSASGNTWTASNKVLPSLQQTVKIENHGVVNPYTKGAELGRSFARSFRTSLTGRH